MKKFQILFLSILITFLGGILFLVFGFFGWIIIELEGEKSENFSVIFQNQKTEKCDASPCEIRVRAGKVFGGKVEKDGFLPKSFGSQKVGIWAKVRVFLALDPAPQIKILDKPSVQKKGKTRSKFKVSVPVFGSKILDGGKNVKIFGQKIPNKIVVKIADETGNMRNLTFVNGQTENEVWARHFSVQGGGIVLPAENGVYFYDLARGQKTLIADVPARNFDSISVKNPSTFLGKIGDDFWIFDRRVQAQKPLDEATKSAFFWNESLLELRGQTLFFDGEKYFPLPENLKDFDQNISMQKNVLRLESAEKVAEISF